MRKHGKKAHRNTLRTQADVAVLISRTQAILMFGAGENPKLTAASLEATVALMRVARAEPLQPICFYRSSEFD